MSTLVFMKAGCCYCDRFFQNTGRVRECFHHPAQGTGLAAQAQVARWVEEARRAADVADDREDFAAEYSVGEPES